MNVDGTTLYPQESYWHPGDDYVELGPIEASEGGELFARLGNSEPINADDGSDETCVRPLIQNAGHVAAIKSMLVVPIRRGPRTVGAIAVSDTSGCRSWDNSEIAFVSYLCDLMLRMLDAHDRQVAEEGLRGFNEMLEARVKSRTRELEETLETLELAQEELVRSEKMASLGGLVAGVAHEINTPLGVALTSISHLGDALRSFKASVETGRIRKSDLTGFVDTADESTSVVLRNLQRAAHLIRSFKMVAVDQSAGDSREISLGHYIEEIAESLQPTLRKNGVKVVTRAQGDMTMRTMPGDLSHILTNLIMNSAMHAFAANPDQKARTIKITARRLKSEMKLEVADNGRGIPVEIRDKIFEPFFTTARATGGSGLGLNIVYNTVYQKLGGSIEVKDAKGGGAVFIIHLPV
jgi:signal transduction histidine kinase